MFIKKDSGYGFIKGKDMPDGKYESVTIDGASTTEWLAASEVSDLADNHCGAVAATNIALFYGNRGYCHLKQKDSKIETFKEVHQLIGDGPVMCIAAKTRRYFLQQGYPLFYRDLGLFSNVKQALKKGNIIGILLANKINDWHWVLCVGYREYENGNLYLRIINGWDQKMDWYYKIHDKVLWISATAYSMGHRS